MIMPSNIILKKAGVLIVRLVIYTMVQSAHERCHTRIMDTTFSGQQRQFWKYIKAMKKDTSSIPSLTVNDQTVISAKEKASVLNDQFQSVFTVKDLTTIPEKGTGNFHTMQLIQFSESEIQILLQTLKPISHQVLTKTQNPSSCT